jgi:hypothetical protein
MEQVKIHKDVYKIQIVNAKKQIKGAKGVQKMSN